MAEMTAQTPVIIFGDDMSAYGVIRALGPKKIPIHIVSRTGKGLSTHSKYANKILTLDWDDANFIEKLITWSHREVGSEAVLIVAGDDEYLDILSQNYDSLAPNLKPTFPTWDVVKKVRHKRETYKIAERIGIPVPKTVYITSDGELNDVIRDGLQFPLLMKTEESKQFYNKYRMKGIVVQNENELFENYIKYECFYGKLLLQEMIPGGEQQLFNFIGVYNKNSEPIKVFMNRKRRSYRKFLSCTLMETMWSNDVLDYSNRLIKELGYIGYANPEFKYDERDGQLKLMEINGRVSKSNSHALRCGINIIEALYNEALVGPLPPQTIFKQNYPDDILWWTPIDDLMASIYMFKEGTLKCGDYFRSIRGKGYIMEPITIQDHKVFLSYAGSLLKQVFIKIRESKKE